MSIKSHNIRFRRLLFVCTLVVGLVACTRREPDRSLILWNQPAPEIAAKAHAAEINGIAYNVLPTGSMEPYLTGGDYVVVDTHFLYDKLAPYDLVNYQPYWSSLTVTHAAAEKSGDNWIMDGIANEHYERGIQSMSRVEYRGKVVQIYTKRAN